MYRFSQPVFTILKDEIINKILVKRQNRAVSTLGKNVSLLKDYKAMKDKKKLEELLKVIKRIDHKNPGMQEITDVSMIEVCAEESVSSEKVFFYFCCCLYLNTNLGRFFRGLF